jgi:hypothetical protein
MFDEVRSAVATLKTVVRDLEPGVLDGPGAVRLVELFAEAEHVAAAGKAIATRRVDAAGAYREGGHRSAGELLAAVSGVTVGAAESVLRTAKRLDHLPATNSAFRAGELSEIQAREIADAASKDPSAETALLRTARRQRVKGLKEHCARVVAASIADDEEWARQLHDQRAMYTWSDHGAFRADVTLAPDRAAGFHAALEAETELLFREARSQGRREARAAYMADALANLVDRGPRKPIDVRVNTPAAALERGHVVAGEVCEIEGLGPIPVAVARKLTTDARVTLLVRDETDHISQHLLGDPHRSGEAASVARGHLPDLRPAGLRQRAQPHHRPHPGLRGRRHPRRAQRLAPLPHVQRPQDLPRLACDRLTRPLGPRAARSPGRPRPALIAPRRRGPQTEIPYCWPVVGRG